MDERTRVVEECPYCGADLFPDETCDCDEEKIAQARSKGKVISTSASYQGGHDDPEAVTFSACWPDDGSGKETLAVYWREEFRDARAFLAEVARLETKYGGAE